MKIMFQIRAACIKLNSKLPSLIAQSLLVSVLIVFPHPANAGEKFKIAINDLDAFGVPETLAQSASDLLRTELFRTGYFHVMERKQMKKILEEQTFQLSGATEDDIVAIGKLLAVNLMVMGSINRLGEKLIINIRMIDVEEARVKAAETVNAQSEGGIPAAIKILARQMSESIPLRGKVIGVKNSEVIVSLGRLDGVEKGMTLRVQRLGEIFKDPSTGKVLGRAVIEVALLRVNSVMNDSLSNTLIVEKYADIKLNDIVIIWTGTTNSASKEAREGAYKRYHEEEIPISRDKRTGDVDALNAGNVSRYIEMLRSKNAVQVKKAAKGILRASGQHSSELLQVVKEELLNGYKVNVRDNHHIDAMAWLCKVLGASRQSEYIETLEEVVRETRNRKLRKYAKKSLANLR